MAWSFKKKVRIAPDISLNLSKGGISTSIGPRGAKLTFGPRGTYLNTSIPGTGLYNRQKINSSTYSGRPSSVLNNVDSTYEDYGVDMEMSRTGIVSFSFTDSLGHQITDDATIQRLIRKTKNLPNYKEKLATLTKMTYDEVNADTEAFTDIYKKTPQLKTVLEVNTELGHITQKQYSVRVFEEKGPDKEKIRQRLMTEAQGTIHYFFWWKNKPAREEYVERQLPIEYEKQLREWELKRNDFNAKEAKIKSIKDAEYYYEYLETKQPLEVFLSRNEDAILHALKAESTRIEELVPGDFDLSFYFDYKNSALYVELDLPEVEEIPKDKAVYLPSGRVSFKQKTIKEIQLDYVKCICGLAFFVAGHMYNVNSSINIIQVSGYSQRINKSTGTNIDEYLYSVIFDRDAFSLLDNQHIEPLEALLAFPCRIKYSATGILSPINPFEIPDENELYKGYYSE